MKHKDWKNYDKVMAIHNKAVEACDLEKMRFAWKVSRTLWAIRTQHIAAKTAKLKMKYPNMYKN